MATRITNIQSEHDGKKILASISANGAELQSLRVSESSTTDKKEFLWQGESKIWSGRAPILFPIVGALKYAPARYQQHLIGLEKHGFARNSNFSLLGSSENSARFGLVANERTLGIYPWKFRLQVQFELSGATLTVLYQVENQDDKELLFNIGSHPAFRLPTFDQTEKSTSLASKPASHSDYCIQFNEPEQLERYGVTDTGLLTTDSEPYPLKNQSITLNENIFDHDALVFRDIKSRRITLAHKDQGPMLTVDTGGAPHLGLWAKPGAHFVCIEPWWGHADFENANDQFEQKDSIQRLQAGETFQTAIKIELHTQAA